MLDESDYFAMTEERPFVCYDCGAAIDPDEDAEIEAHRDEHWFEFLRAQCPIDPDLLFLRNCIEHHGYERGMRIASGLPLPLVIDEEEPEVPF